MRITTKYDLGQILYLKTCKEQLPGIVISIVIVPGSVMYTLSFAGEVSDHYELEVCDEVDVVMRTS